MAYSAKVMDHFANPRNVGEMKDYSGVGEVGNPKCGDIMRCLFYDFRLRGGHCHQQHGHEDDQRQIH